MNFTNILVISTLFIVNIFASDCNEGFVKIGDKCYYEKHISLLKEFINTNVVGSLNIFKNSSTSFVSKTAITVLSFAG